MHVRNEKAVSEEKPRHVPGMLRNISWLGLANVSVKPLWFVFITAACMRLLGIHEFGVMTAALSLGMIATAFVDLGMTQYTTREVSRDPAKASLFFSNFMMLRLANSLLAWLAALAAAFLLGYRGTAFAAVAFAGLYTLMVNLTNYCRGIFRAFEDLRQEAAMLVIEKLLVIGGGLLLLVSTQLASWTLAGMAAGMTLATAANMWWIDHRFAKIRLDLLSRPFMKRSLKIMIPFGLAGFFTVVYYRVDMVMVEAFLGEAPTGQYGAAFRILEALFMLPTLVALAAVYPRLSRLHHSEEYSKFGRLLRNSFMGLVGLSLLITAIVSLAASPIIQLLDSDPAYGPAAGALRILVWSFPFLCANFLLYSALLSMDHQRFASGVLGFAVVLNVGLNAFMIPMYGINGAAVATVIPEVILVGIYLGRYRYARRRRAIRSKI